MSWLGPKQANYQPPAMMLGTSRLPDSSQGVGESRHLISALHSSAEWSVISPEHLKAMASLLVASETEQVSIAKVVPSANGPMLQLTYDQTQPRHYIPLMALAGEPNAPALAILPTTLTPEQVVRSARLEQYDQQQARWLASYYTGRPEAEISTVAFQTEFDGDYPWVNRLLPVYKVVFAGEDQLTAYIHTESLQLAGLANQTRFNLQTVFRLFHTFDFLDAQNNLRVGVVFLAMFCLLGVSISGLGLVLLIRRRKIKQGDRRWHRRLGYVIWLPLLAWSISGGYHLIQAAFIDTPTGLRLHESFDFKEFSTNTQGLVVPESSASDDLAYLDGKTILAASLLNLNGQLVYRLSLSDTKSDEKSDAKHTESSTAERAGQGGEHDHHQQLVKKYNGNPAEKASVYLDAFTLAEVSMNDEVRATELALTFTQLPSELITGVETVTRFGPDYDFRNKRLPVWKVSFDDAEQRQVFIDPATALLVDQTRAIDRAERWSFSMLHKWNMLIPVMGRFNRDVVIVVTLCLLTLITVFGIRMGLARRASARRAEVQGSETAGAETA
jgi:hypothetical protein